MENGRRFFTAALALSLFIPFLAARSADQRSDSSSSSLERGRYLVESVAVCWNCHTPRDESGTPIRSRWLAGGAVPLSPANPAWSWAVVTPRLAGLPPGTAEEFVRLLTTGIARTGEPPRPPMPRFSMTRADAEAVYTYLKSLQPPQ